MILKLIYLFFIRIKLSTSNITLTELNEMILTAKCLSEKLNYVDLNDEIFIKEIPEVLFLTLVFYYVHTKMYFNYFQAFI